MEDEIIGFVYKTKRYDAFKFIKGNRDVNHSEAIKKSMSEYGSLMCVITVNENMEIIDGQNRFIAAKELGEPVYYFVAEGYGIKETRIMNQSAKNWSAQDYINSYADDGKKGYLDLKKLQEMFPDLPASMIVYIAKGNLSNNSGYGTDAYQRSNNGNVARKVKTIQKGEFEVQDMEKAIALGNMIMSYKGLDDNRRPIYKRREFIAAIIKLNRIDEFDEGLNAEIVKKIKAYPRQFVPCVSSDDYIRMLEEILNYKRRTGRIRFGI